MCQRHPPPHTPQSVGPGLSAHIPACLAEQWVLCPGMARTSALDLWPPAWQLDLIAELGRGWQCQ